MAQKFHYWLSVQEKKTDIYKGLVSEMFTAAYLWEPPKNGHNPNIYNWWTDWNTRTMWYNHTLEYYVAIYQ